MKYLVCALWLLVWLSPVRAQEPEKDTKAYIISDSVSIPTRSGVDISALVVHKEENASPLPVVLFYTTYYQGPNDSYFAKLSADKGYVGVVAYARGIRTNPEAYAPYENEGADIYDIIHWISQQPWSNGKVGMYGGSYTGFAQWAATKNLHPALKTIVPQVAVMPGFDTPMENNVQMNLGLYWPHTHIYKRDPIRRSLPFEWFQSGVAFRRMDSLAGYENAIFQKWIDHPAYDSYWQSMVPDSQAYAELDIPVLSTTGYYDGSQIGALQYFKLHHQYNPNPNHYLVIGPYDHWGGQRKPAENLMGYEIDSVANVSMMDLAYDWLDHVLLGQPKPEILKDKVNYQVMNTNKWKHAPTLQAMNNDTLTFYLNGPALSRTKPDQKDFEEQVVNFKDRDTQHNYYTPEIIFDSLDASNGLVFETDPLAEEFYMNGSFTGSLLATINKEDMDVSLALYEHMPDGQYFFLTRYVGRASYAEDPTSRRLLTPGVQESIPLGPTRFISKKIGKGSRLVVLLNINKHPFEIINYGSGKPVANESIKDAGEPLYIQWHNDSHINIPVWKE